MKSKKNLTLGSLFDGSGGFPLGGLLCGITPVWASEIEPFPIRVTTKRLPFMKHYGDVSKIDGAKVEPVDIITFGSPCTDMSIAGKRAGLKGEQSVLFYEAVRIIKEMRCATNGKYPRYCVWENVPGAFSSHKGEDFKSVLEALIDIVCEGTEVPMPEKGKWPHADIFMGDGWSIAYRTLDAQYWGVPQRRKRIYLVADFAGQSAGKILFKSEGLSGYSAESFRAWQRATGNIKGCTYASGFDGYNRNLTDSVSSTLGVNCGISTGCCGIVLNDQGGSRMDVTTDVTCTLRAEAHHPPLVFENHSQDSRYTGPLDVAQTVLSTFGIGGNNQPFVLETPKTLKIRSGCKGGGKGPIIQDDRSATLSCNNDQTLFQPHTYGIGSFASNGMLSDNPNAGIYEADKAKTIDGNGGNPACQQGGTAVVETYALQGSMIGRKNENGPQGDGINEDVSFTLNTIDRHAVYAMNMGGFQQANEEVSPTLMARDYKDPPLVNEPTFGIGRDAMNQGRNSQFSPSVDKELQPTLVAKGPGAVMCAKPSYMVRRLTPTECARLQGFPDWWCEDLETTSPNDADIRFWHEVFETYRKVMGSPARPKSEKQIIRWLKSPHSDTAEYKMWGNGVALPCVYFVMTGIVWASQME